MTKKYLALLMAALMALSLTHGALAETWVIQEAGITIEVPAGLVAEDISDAGYYQLLLTDPNDENIAYSYTVLYEETLDGVWLEDLDEAQMMTFIEIFTGEGEWFYAMNEYDGALYAVVTDDPATQVHVAALLNGWMCIASGYASDGYVLADAAIADMDTLLTGISFAE